MGRGGDGQSPGQNEPSHQETVRGGPPMENPNQLLVTGQQPSLLSYEV